MFTNFKNGVASLGIPQIGQSIPTTTGTYFFVHSGTGSVDNRGTSPDRPLATVDQAINKCTADKMDVIIVMPGHSETLASASAITCDIAGVQIIGLGIGTLRPAFSFSETDSTIIVSAANVTWANCRFSSAKAELVTCFTVTGAGFTMDRCGVTATATSMINFLTAATLANYLAIQNCDFVTTAIPTANNYLIHLVGTDNVSIRNNHFQVLTSNHSGSGVLLVDGTLAANMLILDNYIYSIGTAVIPIRILTASTGLMANNQVGTTKTDADAVIIADAIYKFNNLTTNTAGGSGYVDPNIDTSG